jgi:hypothetical protein
LASTGGWVDQVYREVWLWVARWFAVPRLAPALRHIILICGWLTCVFPELPNTSLAPIADNSGI